MCLLYWLEVYKPIIRNLFNENVLGYCNCSAITHIHLRYAIGHHTGNSCRASRLIRQLLCIRLHACQSARLLHQSAGSSSYALTLHWSMRIRPTTGNLLPWIRTSALPESIRVKPSEDCNEESLFTCLFYVKNSNEKAAKLTAFDV